MQLIFDTKQIIKKVNTSTEFYEIKEKGNVLEAIKKYKNKKGRNFSVIIPSKIKILPEAIGLIVGEGYIGQRSFVFANSNERAIDIILDFIKQFNIQPRFYLEISIKGKSKNFINICKTFWEKHLNLKINRIRLRKEFYNSGNKGTIHITICNSLIAKLLNKIIHTSKIKIEKNKILSAYYLKGILAAEGNVNVKKSTNCVYMIRISASKPEEREHYKRCLEMVGIKIYCKDMPTISSDEGIKLGWKTTKGRAGAVIISRWDNFVKVFELDLLDINDEKKKKFLNYFINNKFTKQFFDFKGLTGKEFTMKQAQEYFGFSGKNLNRVLTFLKKGYVSRRNVNNSKLKFVYKLTNKYFSLYHKLKSTLDNPTFQ